MRRKTSSSTAAAVTETAEPALSYGIPVEKINQTTHSGAAAATATMASDYSRRERAKKKGKTNESAAAAAAAQRRRPFARFPSREKQEEDFY